MTQTDIILFCNDEKSIQSFILNCLNNPYVHKVVSVGNFKSPSFARKHQHLNFEFTEGVDAMHSVLNQIESKFFVLVQQAEFTESLEPLLQRHLQILANSNAQMTYCNFVKNGALQKLIAYQDGSLRDDFDFGYIQCFKTDCIPAFINNEALKSIKFSAHYALRLQAAQLGTLCFVPEPGYSLNVNEAKENKHFKYLEADQQTRQLEMEKVCTDYLKKIGVRVKEPFKTINYQKNEVSATVIIPVRNRVKTIKDAVESILTQKVDVPLNIIAVDNHSTDGTTELLQHYSGKGQLVHVIPQSKQLGIGGCWNQALNHEGCGTFAIQLDSDDLYINENTVQKIVDAFVQNNAAMVIGSYQLVDFDLNELPPGLIDHKEWTDANGPNNGLRINGFGAPRAYNRDIARKFQFPNVSYGEDYAMVLRIASEYKTARIYDALYLCRRWQDNTDASLSQEKKNEFNTYKDWLRTQELNRRLSGN